MESDNKENTRNGNDKKVSALSSTQKKCNNLANNNQRLRQVVLLVLLVLSCVAFLPIVSIFFIPLLLAATFTALFYPLYKYFVVFFKGQRSISSFVCCAIFLIGLLIPLGIILNIVIHQTFTLYTSAEPIIRELLEKGSQSTLFNELTKWSIFRWIQNYNIEWQSILQDLVKQLTSVAPFLINKTSSGLFGLFANLFVMLFTMFYFFVDGEKILKRLRYLSPVRNEYQNIILDRFLLISRATIVGTMLIGFIQGSFGAITLLVFGIKSWLLWGFIMIILAIIPMAGTWIVLIPAGIIQFFLGNVWQGIGIILTSVIVVSNIDNLIRPRIVGHGAKMHDLLIFFSTLGGLSLFGVTGFIVGPIIASFFITMVDIYELEFQTNQEFFDKHE
jgi:predicted PurR-regulated permease PerM